VVRDLEDLDRRRPERQGHVALGVGREQDVGRAVRDEQHDRALIRVVARPAGVLGPEHADPQRPDTERLAGAGDRNAHAAPPRFGHRVVPVRAGGALAGIEEEVDVEPSDHVQSAADVVALGVREDE
jgi:hypothetical protein